MFVLRVCFGSGEGLGWSSFGCLKDAGRRKREKMGRPGSALEASCSFRGVGGAAGRAWGSEHDATSVAKVAQHVAKRY